MLWSFRGDSDWSYHSYKSWKSWVCFLNKCFIIDAYQFLKYYDSNLYQEAPQQCWILHNHYRLAQVSFLWMIEHYWWSETVFLTLCSTGLPLASIWWVQSIFSSKSSLNSKQCCWLTFATSTIFPLNFFGWNTGNQTWGECVQKQPFCYAAPSPKYFFIKALSWTGRLLQSNDPGSAPSFWTDAMMFRGKPVWASTGAEVTHEPEMVSWLSAGISFL